MAMKPAESGVYSSTYIEDNLRYSPERGAGYV